MDFKGRKNSLKTMENLSLVNVFILAGANEDK